MKRRLTRNTIAALAPLLAVAPFAHAQEEGVADAAEPQLQFMRTTDEAGVVTLDLAAREFSRKDNSGPKVWLVGVAHVADQSLYVQHQALLAEFDVVLFESVMPAGTIGTGDIAPEQRAEATKQRMQFLGTLIERHHEDVGTYPADLDQLTQTSNEIDSRLVSILPNIMRDAWGRDLAYSTADSATTFTLLSLGEDGAPGGAGAGADIAVTDRDELAPAAVSADGGLQAELASTLGLAFQLTALSYAQPNFRPSDMTMDQLAAVMSARNLDVGDLEGALDATSMPAQLMTMLLRFVKMADQMLGGAIADVCRLAIIEILGNEQITQHAMQQFGEGFGDVIIGERNQVVIDDLRQIIEREDSIDSVAIYYGAAHMPDFVERLRDQLGYEASEEVKWYQAMRVDLNNSAMPREQLEMTRAMLRKSMHQQMKAMQRGR
jgi:hypothetical protein